MPPRPPRLSLVASSLCAALTLAAASLEAQRPLNLDFERAAIGDSSQPWGWGLGWSAFGAGSAARFALDAEVRHGGRRSLRISVSDTAADAPPRAIQLQLPASFARGHVLRLRGVMRSRELRGAAFVQLEAWGDRVVVAGDTATLRGTAGTVGTAGATGTSAWTPFSLGIRVPASANIHSVVVIASAQGAGTAWFDDLSLALDGRDIRALPPLVRAATATQLASLVPRVAWVRTVEAGDRRDTTDLAALARIVGTASIVGLGESTHGTHEFFQVKHRILRALVERHGFRVFAIEANQLAVERINAWVQGGGGTARDVARAMFQVWNTQEMIELLEWLRDWNARATTPVQFVGYDMQDHILPRDSLMAWLRQRDPSLVERADQLTRAYRAQPSFTMPQVDEATRRGWSDDADTLEALVTGRRSAWLAAASAATDSAAIERAVHHATLLAQAARLNASLYSPDRDSLMAANVAWLLRTRFPGQRAVLWAHDIHVSKGGDRARSFNGGAQLGAHLARTYGFDYRAISLLTARGAYTATRGFTNHERIAAPAFPAPAGSVEQTIAALRRPGGTIGLVLDLRHLDVRTQWLRTPRPLRSIGYAAYDYGFELSASMPLEFDGVVFIDETTPSRVELVPSRTSSPSRPPGD